MLTLERVRVNFSDFTALTDVELTVAPGEVVALLGPSGGGKSTLLRAVAGLEPLAAGRICWQGTDLVGVPVHRRGVGLMFQDGVLFPHRTVAGNVAYGVRGSRAQRPARVQELLDLVGLPGFGPRRVGSLSGGQAQRVALARALAPGPRVLLLDEPLAALDRLWREKLAVDLRAILTGSGVAALFVTHDQDEAYAVADRVGVLRSGRLAQVGPPAALWSAPVDDWVAGFLGFSAVVAAADLLTAGAGAAEVSGVGDRVALRPKALLVSAAGRITGRCTSVRPGPDALTLTVEVAGLGVVPASSDHPVAIGDLVGLLLNTSAIGRVGVLASGPGHAPR